MLKQHLPDSVLLKRKNLLVDICFVRNYSRAASSALFSAMVLRYGA